VTAVGIINLVLGVLNLGCGMCMLGCGSILTTLSSAIRKDPRATSFQAEQLETGSELFLLMGVGIFALGGLMPIAGLGVLDRRRWGRTLSLFLAILSGAVAGLEIYHSYFILAFFFIAYCLFVIGILTNKEYESEFR
jgi:hypothetical protein